MSQFDVTNLPNGLSLAERGTPLGKIGVPIDTNWCVFQEDFLYGPTGLLSATHTPINGTLGFDAAKPSVLTQVLGGADNDLSQLYVAVNSVWPVPGKKLFWRWNGKIVQGASGVLGQEAWFVGIAPVQTGAAFMAADGLSRTFDRGIGFLHLDDDVTAGIACVQGNLDTFTTINAATTYSNNTYMTLDFYYDGADTYFYKDGKMIGKIQAGANLPNTGCCPYMLYIEAGEARAKTLCTDYVLIAQER